MYTSGFVLVVNAEVDSMGGVVDSGIGISSTPSLQQSSDLEKTQAELRQTFTAAEKFRRELEFLQKGGDPLDLKPGNAASVSFQSTSFTDRHPEQFVTSEAKGSFAITASPHGDSVESSGRLGAPSVCEPNSADNLMLFDGDNKFQEIGRKPVHPHADNTTTSEHYSQLDVGHITTGDSAVLELPKKSYKRRIRSRPNRDGARSSSTDAVPSRGAHFLPFRHASRDFKGSTHDADNQERNCLLNSNSKPKSPNASVAQKNSTSQLENNLDGVPAVQSTLGPAHGPYSAVLDVNALQNTQETHLDQPIKSDSREAPLAMASIEPEPLGGMEQVHLTNSERPPHAGTPISENLAFQGPTNGFGSTEEIKGIPDDSNSGAAIPTKILDSESSCTQTSQHFDGYNGNGFPTSARLGKYTGSMEQNLVSKDVLEVEGNDLVSEKDDKILNIDKANSDTCHPSHNEDGSAVKEEEGLKGSESVLHNELKYSVSTKGVGSDSCAASKTERKASLILGPNSISQAGNACSSRPQGSIGIPFKESTLSARHSTDAAEQNACTQNNLKLVTKEREDSILEEARIIEAKRKRIAELSVRTLPLERRLKSQWDFVLEEMSWLANDFAQERLWKVTAAAQISRRVAFASRVRFQQQCSLQKQKEVAHTLAQAVMQFWHMIQVKCKESESHCLKKDHVGIHGYAMRFLEYNSSQAQYSATQAPATPDCISDLGIMDLSWEDNLTEENLFYTVPPGAIESYRKAIESHLQQFERTGSSMQEEVDTSGYDAVADDAFEEDEGETSTYYLPGVFEGSKSTKTAQKGRKNFKLHGARSYEMGGDLSLMQSAERTVGTQPSVLSVKRSASSLNVSFPTKRVRTASRQRIISPFNAGTSGCIQAPNRTDASSGDTNSFQDEQSTLHGGSQIPNNMEAESVGDYEKQLQFDSMEVSNRPKKKKKAKHPGSTFEHRWQLDSNFQNEQKDHSRRRLDTHQFDSNGSSVASQMSNMSNPNKFMKLLVRDRGRKAKALKTPVGQPGSGSPWSLFEDQALVVLVHDMGPNWELISDAINSTLQFKCIFRKSRECKERHKILMDRNTGDGADSAEDSGSSQPYPSTLPGIPEGSARQLFQRLQGPMEEDTLKSHFEKIIKIGQKQHYRRTQNDNQDPKQLQQPHSSHAFALSQVCPNNLNGGPVLTPLELSEAISASPDVLPVGYQGPHPHSGGLPVLNHGTVAPMLPGSGSTSSTPGSSNSVHGSNLPSASAPLNPSVREGRYGIPRTGSLSVDDQQRMQQYNQMLSARNTQQSGLPPGSHSVTDRGVRMLPAGNGMGVMSGMNRSMKMPRPGYQGIPSPSMLSSGNILSSGTATPSPASMHSGAGPGQGNSMLRPRDAMHMIRPNQNADHQKIVAADLQMQQVSQSGVTQGVPPFAGGTSSSFPNQISQPSVQSYPLHHQQQARPISPQQSPHLLSSNSHHPHHFQGPPNHAANTTHPTYGMRLVKERQLQQQRLLQQQQLSTSNAMMLHAQPQESQLPVSSPQNSTQMQSRSSSPPVSLSPMGTPSMTPMPQLPQKHPVSAPHGLARNPQTSGNQLVKQQRQRQSQQFQQPDRLHHQQRQQAPHQQQAKLVKGGRGTMMMNQNLPTDTSLLNGFSGGQSVADKGEQQVVHHLLQSGQGNLYSGSSALNPVAQAASKQSAPHSSLSQPHQQKTYSGQIQAASSKELQQQKPSHSSDNSNNQKHAPSVVASSTPSAIVSSNHHQHQSQPHQKLVNQKQSTTSQKVLHNRKVNSSDQSTSKLQAQAESPMSLNNSSQPSTTVPMPQAPCNDANSSETPAVSLSAAPHRKTCESFYDSSGAVPDDAGTQFGKNSMRMSPPQTSRTVVESEPSGPAVNQVVVRRQSSSDSLPNPVRHDGDVQWQQQQQPPS